MKKMSSLILLLIITHVSYAQTCHEDLPRTTPDSRYEVLGSGSEVRDRVTGLIWQRCSLGQVWDGSSCTGEAIGYTWSDALTQAKAVGEEYRLPNVKELVDLTDQACYSSNINETFFPNTMLRPYWSSSAMRGENKIWDVSFNYGGTSKASKNDKRYVRAVRQ